MKNYDPDDCMVYYGDTIVGSFAEDREVSDVHYWIVDLSAYPLDHEDYSIDKVRVVTSTFSFHIKRGSDTHKMLIEDGGKTKITIEPKEV
jgi:hypothetical protein